jgi:hypothetical protein
VDDWYGPVRIGGDSARHPAPGELYRQVANALKGKSSRAYVAPFDVRLPKSGEADDEVDTVVQPG